MIAETQGPLPHRAHIHYLASIIIQQVSMNVIKCHFFLMQEFSDIPLLHMYFHVRGHFVRLPLCCHQSHGNSMQQNIGGKVQPLLPYHQHLPLTLWTNIIKWKALLFEQPSQYWHRYKYQWNVIKITVSGNSALFSGIQFTSLLSAIPWLHTVKQMLLSTLQIISFLHEKQKKNSKALIACIYSTLEVIKGV